MTTTTMNKYFIFISLLCALCACSGDDEEDKDMVKPSISESGIVASPIDCLVLHRGDVLPVRYLFVDNVELGNYNIEIHNNFDHHTHSTSALDCELEENKLPVNPWIFNKDYNIPEKLKEYKVSLDLKVPEDIDTGDYHFVIRVTDKAGWQEFKAVSIKVVE